MNRMRSFIMILYLFNVQNVSWGQHDIEWKTTSITGWPFTQLEPASQAKLGGFEHSSLFHQPTFSPFYTNFPQHPYSVQYKINFLPQPIDYPYPKIDEQFKNKKRTKVTKTKVFNTNSNAEPTTMRTTSFNNVKPEKITVTNNTGRHQFVQDVKLIQAVQKFNNDFEIKRLHPVTTNTLHRDNSQQKEELNNIPMVSVTSSTSADKPVNDVPFDSYFNEFFKGIITTPNIDSNRSNGATLILEPVSRAVAGNGGTAISSPISRAVLRKKSGTHILYKPDSVAIVGAGGTAHAQSDLILDYVD